MIVVALVSLALGKNDFPGWWLVGFGPASALVDNTTTTALPTDKTDHFYSSPVINFKTSNDSTSLTGLQHHKAHWSILPLALLP